MNVLDGIRQSNHFSGPKMREIKRQKSAIQSTEQPHRSPLELLPQELKWMLIEYAPIIDLRLASRSIKQAVDSWALQQSSFSLVDTIRAYKKDNKVAFTIKINGPKVKLFVLGLILRQKFYRRTIRRARDRHCAVGVYYDVFPCVNGAQTVGTMSNLIGLRTKEVIIEDSNFLDDWRIISKCLDGIKFRRLQMQNVAITDELANYIRRIIISSEVDSLDFQIRQVYLSNPGDFLIQISMLVRSIHIHQFYAPDTIFNGRYFFGREDLDVTHVFIQMLSNKLEELLIANTNYSNYLSEKGAKILEERLPLLDKKIWFQSTCEQVENGFEYIKNDHVVEYVNSGYFYSDLRISHISRSENW